KLLYHSIKIKTIPLLNLLFHTIDYSQWLKYNKHINYSEGNFMDIEDQFNKEEFAILLDRSKGGRSINQFANETGVSAAHISRFLRKMIASPPIPETISKFAAKAQNNVTYQDLMVAAGHLARKNDIDMNSEDGVERYSPTVFRERI